MSRTSTARAVRRHLLLTIAVTAVVVVLTVIGEILATEAEAERSTTATAGRVSAAVVISLSDLDLGATPPGAASRAQVSQALRPALDSGVVERVKVWRVEGDQVRIVYSDEPRVEGDVRAFDPVLAARLDAGEVVLLDVPDDVEHRYERDHPVDLREVLVGFTDAAGTPMRLELYLATDTTAAITRSLWVQIPLLTAGLVGLGALLIPLSLRTVRRLDRLADERLQAMSYGLDASEEVRASLARRLHDGPVQDLAAVALALHTLADGEPAEDRAAMLRRLGHIVGADTDELRSVAHAATPAADRSLRDHLERLRELHPSPARLTVTEPDEAVPAPVAALLWQVAAELTRNALTHADADLIDVRVGAGAGADGIDGTDWTLVVADDGVGLPEGPAPSGHLGLALVRHAVAQVGGRMDTTTGTGLGTTVTIVVPAGRPD